MSNAKLYNILLIVLLGICLMLWNKTNSEKNHLKTISNFYMRSGKQQSLDIIAKREKQIKFLELKIVQKQKLIDKSNEKIDSLSKLKRKVNVIYINRVKEIKDFNSNKLENYFNEELN